MRIFIDTNIIFKADFFRSTTAQSFLKAAKFLEIEVIIPDIVIDEVNGNFSKELPEKLTKFKKSYKELTELIDINEININISEKIKEYEDWLDTLLEEYEVTRLPYPKVSLKTIVTESYKKKKPFKDNGDGHKDYLIWETIKQYIAEKNNDPDTFFLTNNVKDFCYKKGEDDWPLHNHLLDQIPDDKTAPEIHRVFKDFFDTKIAPQLEGVELKSVHELTQPELYAKAQKIIESDLQDYSAYGFEGLSFCNEVTILSAFDTNPTYIELKEVNDEEILITICGSVSIEANGFIDKHDYCSGIEHDNIDINVIDGNWNDHVMFVSQVINTPFEVSLSYSKEEKGITGHSIELPEEIMDDIYY